MATQNLFLGTGRGKIGDVVLYQSEGQQVARKYVAKIANPKTVGQSNQRNFIAPVARFYSPLADALEKSWQGKTRAQSVREFNRYNINLARRMGWYLTKGSEFWPLPYRVSYGTLPPLQYSIANGIGTLNVPANLPNTSNTVASLTQSLMTLGYLPGDQLTIIAIVLNDATEQFLPLYGRIILDTSNQNEPFEDSLFDLNAASDVNYWGVECSLGTVEAMAAIISRAPSRGSNWLRSTQSMAVASWLMREVTGEDARTAAIASYGSSSGLNESNVYLDGSTTRANVAGGSLVVNFQDLTDGSLQPSVYTFTPVNLVQDGGYLTITGRNAANGDLIPGIMVLNRIDGYAKNDVLVSKTAWSTTPITDGTVAIVRSASDPLAQWLVERGVAGNLFS